MAPPLIHDISPPPHLADAAPTNNNFSDYPVRAAIVAVVFSLTTVFLLLVSPFFFRRLGFLAVFSWLNALAVVWVASQPVF